MGINIDKLTPDEQKRAMCLACERSLLSGQCKCANPNWVLATTYLPGPPGTLNPMPFDKITKKVDVDGIELPFGKKKQLDRPKRGNKYHAVRSKSLITKRWYDSGAERDYADVLEARAADGLITEIVAQPVIELGQYGEIKYKPDFVYWELTVERVHFNIKPANARVQVKKTRQVWVDVKGAETERFKIVKRLWRYNGPGPLEIVKRAGKGKKFLVTQTIMPII